MASSAATAAAAPRTMDDNTPHAVCKQTRYEVPLDAAGHSVRHHLLQEEKDTVALQPGSGSLPTAATTTTNTTTTTTTHVITLQPCKVVYYYSDNTQHTYVLQQQPQALPPQQQQHRKEEAAANGRRETLSEALLPRHHPDHMDPTIKHGSTEPPGFSFADSAEEDVEEGRARLLVLKGSADPSESPRQEQQPSRKGMPSLCPTCGHGACLPASYRPPEYVRDITPANPRIGSPGPLTLFAFGLTTCLYNVHQAGICPLNLTTLGLIIFYGGLAQFVGGFFELVNKNTIFCTLDVTYGAFWMATAISVLVPPNAAVVSGGSDSTPASYLGGFFTLWFVFSGTMFASSFRFSYVQILLNFSVMLNFFLNLLGNYLENDAVKHAAGFEGIAEGCLATYVGMAFTFRDSYGRSVLPLFFHENFRITEW